MPFPSSPLSLLLQGKWEMHFYPNVIYFQEIVLYSAQYCVPTEYTYIDRCVICVGFFSGFALVLDFFVSEN